MSTGDRPTRPLQTGEPQRLLQWCYNDRERAIVVLAWRGGLRRSEIVALMGHDVEVTPGKGSKLHVRCGKNNTSRFVGLTEQDTRILLPLLRAGPVIRNRTGGPVHVNQIYRTVSWLSRRAGLKGRVHPHALRHTYAMNLLDEGFGMREIQRLLGHSNINTTRVYLESGGGDEAVAKSTERKEW